MANFLLIGPQGGGKTEILRSITGKPIPEEFGGTMEKNEEHTGGFLWGCLGADRFVEIGGNTLSLINTIESLKENRKDDFVLYVFDGQSFIQQIKKSESGGEIYGRWLYLKPHCNNLKHVHFIATHADLVPDMKDKIKLFIKEANDKYQTLTHRDRYEKSLFEEAFFHCIDARHDQGGPEQIKRIIEELKSKKI